MRFWRYLRARPDLEVGVMIPIGCLVPLAMLLAVVIGVGVLVGSRLSATPAPAQNVVVRVIDDGAAGGPSVIATTVVPLR